MRRLDAYAMMPGVDWGVAAIAVSTLVWLAAFAGVRTGRNVAAWTALVAAAGAGVALGGVAVQHEPGAASWILAPAAGAALSAVHARAVFGGAGPLRT